MFEYIHKLDFSILFQGSRGGPTLSGEGGGGLQLFQGGGGGSNFFSGESICQFL